MVPANDFVHDSPCVVIATGFFSFTFQAVELSSGVPGDGKHLWQYRAEFRY